MKKINQYKRTYYKEQGALIGLVLCLMIFVLPSLNEEEVVITRPPLTVHKDVIEYVIKPVVAPATTAEPTVEDKIRQYFPRSWKTMIAVAKAESHMSMNAKGWNCFYNEDETIVYTSKVKGSHSTHCKTSHRKYAWSVDCFLLQKNYKGQQCPKGMTLDKHLQEVADLSRVQGLGAWTSYNDGKHLKYLADSN